MKVSGFILLAIMMILAMLGNVVRAGNKKSGERCYKPDDCAAGLTCRLTHGGNPGLGSFCRP